MPQGMPGQQSQLMSALMAGGPGMPQGMPPPGMPPGEGGDMQQQLALLAELLGPEALQQLLGGAGGGMPMSMGPGQGMPMPMGR